MRRKKGLTTIGTMTRWAAFVWLWRYDSEARWFWLLCYVKRAKLQEDVLINLKDFGLTKANI